MSKLHEVLAVLSDLEGAAKKMREEAVVTFTKKGNHFLGAHKTLKMFDENRQQESDGAEEHKALVTTVSDKLDYVQQSQVRYLDALLQMEGTNQNARADLIIDGNVIVADLPATFLLGLESRLKALRAVFETIPTLDPTYEWIDDSEAGEHIYKTKHPVTAQKQEKAVKHQVLVQPTKEHPAQIEKWNENIVVGTYTTKLWSGMISPGQKSDYLERVDTLIKAAKQARQRANTTEVIKHNNIGNTLFDFILGGV